MFSASVQARSICAASKSMLARWSENRKRQAGPRKSPCRTGKKVKLVAVTFPRVHIPEPKTPPHTGYVLWGAINVINLAAKLL